MSREKYEEITSKWVAHWGEGTLVELNIPSAINDEAVVRGVAQLERASASPGSIRALREANYEIDIRHILPAIHVPTLILHRVGDALVPIACGRYLAQNIPGARLVELRGTDHTVIDNETQDAIAGHIEEFITGDRQPSEPDRVLATVMFTDIVGSTQRAAEIGDSRWRQLLDVVFRRAVRIHSHLRLVFLGAGHVVPAWRMAAGRDNLHALRSPSRALRVPPKICVI
jgi:hypothetical protein